MRDTVWEDKCKARWRVIDVAPNHLVLKSVSGEARLRIKRETLLRKYTRLS